MFEDTASQIVEIIWPLSTVALRSDSSTGCKGVLPLRTFIQETLRRSRTSYSTLQVALYYLIKIKPHVPNQDFTKEQPQGKPACRAMQCGRRMFLAALILASKYLQDRNYSARAWSKISGLNTTEINQNELMFLRAVDWRLHIPEATFQRWTDIVLKYTPGAGALPIDGQSWRTIIPRLTPELDTLDVEPLSPTSMGGFDLSPVGDSPSPRSVPASDQPSRAGAYEPQPSGSQNIITPEGPRGPPPSLPRMPSAASQNILTLEGPPRPPPSMPRIPMLPTPQMTPQSNIAPTPAASAGGNGPRRSSIGAAMSQAQSMCMARSTLDQRPPMLCRPGFIDGYPATVRRSSLARSTSSASSPESMVSDASTLSSRSSRSSSISSNSSGGCSASQPRLVKKVLRNTNNSMKENRKPLTIASPIDEGSLTGICSSPESYTGPSGPPPELSNFFSLEAPGPFSSSTHEAAQGLCELARPQSTSNAATEQRGGRKRGRTHSEDMILQNHVRYLINLSTGGDGSVLPDNCQAKSFLIPESSRSQCSFTKLPPIKLPAELSGPAGMKRACCGSEARKVALNPTMRAEYLN